ncbi:MAG TPA: phytoene/squalene synthase family protein [Gemmatimonadaceae bacterium]|nr:phytoene/squalene synthase family protein [Gemmatimonadaceae bacterium]
MVLPGFLKEDDTQLAKLDAQHCESITRAHARTFALASSFLPPRKRRGAFAVYAFCRLADDIVDRNRGKDTALLQAELDAYRAGVAEAIAGRPEGPVFRELWRCVQEFGVPSDVLEELLNGVARDVQPQRYATWAELSLYCEGVAASVGAMCTYIFGVAGDAAVRERALRYARTLGVAMQVTNILRDVGEDALIGRCYLPDDVLSAFGLSAERVLHDPTVKDDPQWIAMMRHEVARARALYRAASPGIALLESDAQRCARACADGYEAILGAIEANGYDSISVRARVGNWARAGLLWSIWRSGAETPPTNVQGPVIEWGARRLSRPEEMVLS